MDALNNFSKAKVLIVGDVMIDRYWWGNVERISPEAPVPVVRLKDTTLVAGGAANVAANVAGLGAQPFLVGAVGDDEEAALFPKLLSDSAISPEFLLKINKRPTTVKTRIIAHNQQVARIDQESSSEIDATSEQRLWQTIEKLIFKSDVVIISDYAKGLLSLKLITRLITSANVNRKLVLVDPKGKNFSKYKNAGIITPNKRETIEACGMDNADLGEIEKSCKKLLSTLNLQSILVTLGEEGMMLLEKRKKTLQLKASAREVYDVTGAGDTVIATLAVALSGGLNFAQAANLSNVAAGLVVEQVGTTAIKLENLRQAIEGS